MLKWQVNEAKFRELQPHRELCYAETPLGYLVIHEWWNIETERKPNAPQYGSAFFRPGEHLVVKSQNFLHYQLCLEVDRGEGYYFADTRIKSSEQKPNEEIQHLAEEWLGELLFDVIDLLGLREQRE